MLARPKCAKMREDRIHGVPLPLCYFFVPHHDAGPKRPYPVHMNLYNINDHYTDYLQCEYDVDEKNYILTEEPRWFKGALEQIRKSGPKKFSAKMDCNNYRQPCGMERRKHV